MAVGVKSVGLLENSIQNQEFLMILVNFEIFAVEHPLIRSTSNVRIGIGAKNVFQWIQILDAIRLRPCTEFYMIRSGVNLSVRIKMMLAKI